MYDGSYFDRLMEVGGLFQNMFQTGHYIWEPFGVAFLSAGVLLVVGLMCARWPKPFRQATAFLVLSAALVTSGVLLLPGAVRMHHSVLVYPFPHLLVAMAFMLLSRVYSVGARAKKPHCDGRREASEREGAQSDHLSVTDSQVTEAGPSLRPSRLCGLPALPSTASLQLRRMLARPGSARTGARLLLFLTAAALLLGQPLAIYRTQRLIRQTGGQGWWSESLNTFCNQVKNRSDLTVVSLDWGFNEQLLFLTQGPTVTEPFWTGQGDLLPGMPGTTNCVYLVHPPEYRLINLERDCLDPAFLAAYHLECQPYTDRTNGVAFYVIRAQTSRL
jgi:hypothetical protein